MVRPGVVHAVGVWATRMMVAMSAIAAMSSPSAATSISLSGGSSAATVNSQTLEFVLVTGTDGSGVPSTYIAAQTSEGNLLTITDTDVSLTLGDFGVMVADIATDAAGRADIDTGGTLYANRALRFVGGVSVASGGSVRIGTLGSLDTAGSTLSLAGPDSLVRTGNGTFSTGNITLGGEATATFVNGDVIAGNATLTGTSSLVVGAPLVSGGWAAVSEGSTLTVDAATNFTQGVFASDDGTLAIAASGSVITPDGVLLYLAGADAFSRTAGGTYSAGILSIADLATVDFVSGDAVSGDVLVDTNATLSIQSPLTTMGDLWVTNGARLSRTAAIVSAATLHVGGASAAESIAGDSFDAVSVTAGGRFSNAATLSLSMLSVSGDDGSGSVSNATTAANLTIADGGSVNVNSGGRLDVTQTLSVATGGSAAIIVSGTASDGTASILHIASAVSGFSSIDVGAGGTLDLDGGNVAADVLALSGSSAFARSGGSFTVGTLYLTDSGVVGYDIGDSISTSIVLLSGATLDLQRDLVLADGLTLGDGATITRSNATISTDSVSVAGLAALALGAGDSIGSVSLSRGGRVSSSTALDLDGSAPLTIADAESQLTLSAFDGLISGATADVYYALRVYGDQRTLLESYLGEGRIVLGVSPHSPAVIYDPALYGNATFIAYVVPEPSTMFFVVCSLPFIRRRRG